MGATLSDGREILAAVPTDLPGIEAAEPARLMALSASHTGAVHCCDVLVENRWILAGPVENVLRHLGGAAETSSDATTGGAPANASGRAVGTMAAIDEATRPRPSDARGSGTTGPRSGGATGGLQTSAVAIGLASAAIDFLAAEAARRSDLSAPAETLRAEHQALADDLIRTAEGLPGCSAENLRSRANSLALRASQAALTAAKGAGYVQGHAANRWCREALFFLIWSCPQTVAAANLCELAGIEE